MYDTGT